MKKQIIKCLIMSMKFILIQIKFNIDMNNDTDYWKSYENIRRK
jgi:hypothetical protein